MRWNCSESKSNPDAAVTEEIADRYRQGRINQERHMKQVCRKSPHSFVRGPALKAIFSQEELKPSPLFSILILLLYCVSICVNLPVSSLVFPSCSVDLILPKAMCRYTKKLVLRAISLSKKKG